MGIYPGIEKVKSKVTETQFRLYVTLHSCVVILFACLLILCLANMYKIVFKTGHLRRNSMIVAFYVYAFLAISCRFVTSFSYNYSYWIDFLMTEQPFAKLCVALI